MKEVLSPAMRDSLRREQAVSAPMKSDGKSAAMREPSLASSPANRFHFGAISVFSAEERAEPAQDTVAHGLRGEGEPLPFLEAIQPAFGPHKLDGVSAHLDRGARQSAQALGATAYTAGEHVAFAQRPSLFTAAHEAAHVVQQRAGVALADGVGQLGDRYEQEADAVAAQVVAGRSAVGLLPASSQASYFPGSSARAGSPVQFSRHGAATKEREPTAAGLSSSQLSGYVALAQGAIATLFGPWLGGEGKAQPPTLSPEYADSGKVRADLSRITPIKRMGDPKLQRAMGYTKGDRIHLAEKAPLSIVPVTLVHELIHTLMRMPSGEKWPEDFMEAATQILAVAARHDTLSPTVGMLEGSLYTELAPTLYEVLAQGLGSYGVVTSALAAAYFQGDSTQLRSAFKLLFGYEHGWELVQSCFVNPEQLVWVGEPGDAPLRDREVLHLTPLQLLEQLASHRLRVRPGSDGRDHISIA